MSARNSWFVALGEALVFALVMAGPMSAQEALATDVALGTAIAAAPLSAPGPLLSLTLPGESLLPGVRISPVNAPAALLVPVQSQGTRSQGLEMMIVGGAGLIVGSIIDGDTGRIIMVGGAAIGLIGLYRYLR